MLKSSLSSRMFPVFCNKFHLSILKEPFQHKRLILRPFVNAEIISENKTLVSWLALNSTLIHWCSKAVLNMNKVLRLGPSEKVEKLWHDFEFML